MRLNQDRQSIIDDIKRVTNLIKENLATFEGHEDVAEHSNAFQAFSKLTPPDFETASNRELAEYRRTIYGIADMQTLNLEETEEYLNKFGSIKERLDKHSTKWGRDVFKAFNKFTELLPHLASGDIRYQVLDMISGSRLAKSDTEAIVQKLIHAYNRALAKAGNDNENELLIQFADEFKNVSRRNYVPDELDQSILY